jgi:hypothetical protein
MLSSIALGLGWQNTHNWEYSRKLNLNSDNDYKKLDIKITI